MVFGEIMDFFAEGKPVMLDEPVVTDTTILDDDDEVVAMIKELLQERVSLFIPLTRFLIGITCYNACLSVCIRYRVQRPLMCL